MLPKIGPMHGVQPAAKANPKRNESGWLAFVRFGKNLFSTLRFLNLVDSNINPPKPIMIIPPIWLNPEIRLAAELDSTLFKITPKIENTTENPRTKKIVFSIMLSLFETRLIVPLFR